MNSGQHCDERSPIACKRDVRSELASAKFCAMSADELMFDEDLQASWPSLLATWDDLTLDEHYGQDLAGTRYRRYTTFTFDPVSGALAPLDHEAYYQSERMNRYVGGAKRHFGDVRPDTYENPLFRALVRFAFDACPIPESLAQRTWLSQIHQIRITVDAGQTTAVTPEGIHSDGYPFASVHLIDRVDVDGGESSVYTYEEQELANLVFERPLDTLLLEDRALKHYVTPIHGSGPGTGRRSILATSFSLPDSEYTTDV